MNKENSSLILVETSRAINKSLEEYLKESQENSRRHPSLRQQNER